MIYIFYIDIKLGYVYIHIKCIYVYMCMYIYMCICVYTLFICIYIYMCVYTYRSIDLYLFMFFSLFLKTLRVNCRCDALYI